MPGFFSSLALVCALCTICSVGAQTGVCYTMVSTQVSAVGYVQTSRSDSYGCGWFRRCRRTLYGRNSIVTYNTQYSSQFGCCAGYQQSGTTCQPVCNGGCSNGGVCTAPDICSCTAGWIGSNCHIDFDECASSSTNNCGQVCNNNPGSFSCSCNTGYRLHADGHTCPDINECTEGSDLCDHICANSIGSYTCSCNTGYTLSSNQVGCMNDNECVLGTDLCSQVCHDMPGSYTCSCRPGYTLDPNGRTCRDIDECATGTHLCGQNCHNTIGSYTCSCNIGYTLSTNQLGCINDNECLLGTHLCSQVCHDTHGSYTCSCRSGYALDPDGRTCRDIDECAIGTHTCEQNCHNTIGSYTCSCNTGYTLNPNGRICDDINECNSPDHGCQHQCVNFPGSYRCQCNIGYSLNADGFTCSDINECAVGTDNCDQVCHNNVGSFSCTCNPGSTLDSNGYNCNDINECAHPDLNNCQQICTNTDRSYYCECNAGYVLDSNQRTCTDIDECEAGSDLCTQNCWNTIGSYTCSCNDGYTLNADGVTCDDIDECAAETDQCEEICINIPRSYNCLCREGYGLNSDEYSCSDIDECAEGTDLCDHDCSNTNGSYTCSCQTGYIIDEDGYTCDDVNECGGDHMCEDACNNTAGSFHCACRPGYIINNDGRTCRDLDECEEDEDMCDQSCHNNIGSYTCSCGEDYTLNFDGFRCDDINECSAGSVGNTTCEEVCVNTPGSWHCDCFPGYTILANEISCRDEDECSTGNNQCDQMCRNTIGSYTCSCNSSTALNADGYRCDDIDECAMDLDGCVEVCVNTYGSFYCSCNTGYTINPDGRSCRDINECLAGTDTCEQLCTNNVGSYNCSCNGGYSLTSNRFSCLGPPGGIVFGAINSTTMTLTWGLPQNDSRDGAVINYVVDCDSQSDQWYALDVMRSTSDERRVVLRNLRPYYTYTCCVLVETNIGRSPPACVEQTTLEEEPSNPPQNIIINNDADDSLTFNFDPPVTINGIIIAYTFYVTFENGSSVVIVDNVATGSFHLEGLLPYQLVTVEVSANTSAGEGPKSAVDEIRTAQAVPSKPTAVVVRVTSNSSLTTAWNPPAMDNGILLNYTVRIVNQLNEYSREFVLNPSDLRFISVDDLEPYIPYTVEVAASTVMGKGEPAREIIFTEHGVPVIPTISNVVRTSEGVVKVFWIPLTPDEARGVLTLLQIAYEPATNGLCYDINEEDMRVMTLLENVDTQSEAEIDGLEGSREYCVAIQVSTSAGESGFTDTLKAHYPSDVYVQIRLKLSNQYCGTYIDENPIEKSTAISSAIVKTLLLVCDCPYSLEYVTHSRLLCGSNENEAIYQANLLNTDGKTATDLKDVIQLWVDNAPRIRVAGSFQQVDSYCSVNVTEVGNVDECTALNPTTPTEPVVESTKQTLLSNHITAIAWGVGGGVATIFLVVVVIVLVCTCRRKRAGSNLKDKAGFNLNAENDNTQLIGQRDIGTLSRNIVNSHTPANYDQVQYDNPVYGTGPDEAEETKEDLDDDNDFTELI